MPCVREDRAKRWLVSHRWMSFNAVPRLVTALIGTLPVGLVGHS